jgi:hypothetical protein
MPIEQDIRDLREDFRALRTRVQAHELVTSILLAHLLNVAKKAGVKINMNDVIGQMVDDVEGNAKEIEKSDPMGAASIRAIGSEVVRLLKPAAASRSSVDPANET